MLELIRKFVHDEDGQGMAEYGLILALVAVVVIGALALLGEQINDAFTAITDRLGEEDKINGG